MNLPGNRPSVLFVCTANVCRSPMAEGIFKSMVAERDGNYRKWKIRSAGTWTRRGIPAAEDVVTVLAVRGIDIRGHVSQPIDHVPIDRYRLILVMEIGQKEAIQVEFPKVAERTFLLSEMVEEVRDIVDPIGKPLEEFERTATEIEHILKKGYSKICELAHA